MRIPRRARAHAYQAFYRVPGHIRRRIVRLVVPKYLVGAVTLITDSEVAAEPGAGSGAGGEAGCDPASPRIRPAGRSGRLLLLRQPPGRAWGLPAGLLKRHEPPAVGAARELFEETGVRLDPGDLEPATPNAIVHAEGWVDMVFHGSVPASTTRLAWDGGEVLEARWFPFDDLPPLTSATERLLGLYGIGPVAAVREEMS